MELPNLLRLPQGQGCRRCACHTMVEDEDGVVCAACGTRREQGGIAAPPGEPTLAALYTAIQDSGWRLISVRTTHKDEGETILHLTCRSGGVG